MAAGDDIDTIIEGYPWLERQDILACLAYAHRLVGHERIEPAFQESHKWGYYWIRVFGEARKMFSYVPDMMLSGAVTLNSLQVLRCSDARSPASSLRYLRYLLWKKRSITFQYLKWQKRNINLKIWAWLQMIPSIICPASVFSFHRCDIRYLMSDLWHPRSDLWGKSPISLQVDNVPHYCKARDRGSCHPGMGPDWR